MSTPNPIRRRTFLSVALASAASAIAACGFSGGTEPTTGAPGAPAGGGAPGTGPGSGTAIPAATGPGGAPAQVGGGTLRQSMAPVPHLDPAISGSGSASGNILQSGLMEGLVVSDADDGSTVLPGVAKSWTVSADQTVYTFALRADAKWSNGDRVTAADFVWNWERGLNPATPGEGSPSYSVMTGIVGAADYLSGKSTDFSTVGVVAKDDATLEITLTAPDPNLLAILAQWRMLPLHPKTVQAHPKDWGAAENWVGNGPFVIDSWRANAGCTLVSNEHYWDTASYPVDRWEVTFIDGGDPPQMLRYQANEIDLFRVVSDVATVIDDPALEKQLAVSASGQFRCLVALSSKNPLLEDVRIRKALSLAIDREALSKLVQPDRPGGSLVPDGIPGHDEIPATPFDLEQSKALLADAGYPDAKGLPTLKILLPRQAPWAEAVGGMWLENLGVQTAIDIVETGVFLKKWIQVQAADYVGFAYGNFGITPTTFYNGVTNTTRSPRLDEFMLGAGAVEYRTLQADAKMDRIQRDERMTAIRDEHLDSLMKKYYDLVDQAMAQSDPKRQHGLLVQAAIAREECYIAIPVLWGGYNFMVSPRVHDLTIAPYPEVFSLHGVSVSG